MNTFFIPHMNMLVNEGNQVDCACRIKGEHKIYKEKIDKNIKFYDIPFTRNPLNISNLLAFYKLYKIQKENSYDIIHVHTPIASFYTRLLKIFFKEIKMIYTAHGFHFFKGANGLGSRLFYRIEKKLSEYTDVLVTINDEDYNAAKKFSQKKLVKINGVGIDLKEFKIINDIEKKNKIRNSIGINKDDFVLIMVGEHNSNKNQIQLIKAMELLKDEIDNIKAIFIGDGVDIEKNKEYIKNKNIDNCLILGFRKDVCDLINISDILVSLSYREGLPKNVLEGLALGKVILGTNTRGTRDLVNDNGYLVDYANIEQTKEIIKKLYYMDQEVLERLAKSSLINSKNYSINKVLCEMKKIYEIRVEE